MIITASGKNEASSILNISRRCQFISQQISTRPTAPTAKTIQNHVGAATRTGPGAAGAAAGACVAAAACGLAGGVDAAPSGGGSCSPDSSFGGSCSPPARVEASSAAMEPPA